MSIEKQPENGLGTIQDLQLSHTQLDFFDFLVYNLYKAPKTSNLFFPCGWWVLKSSQKMA